MYIVEIGNGVHMVGPFDTYEQALTWANDANWSTQWNTYSINVFRLEKPANIPVTRFPEQTG